MTEPIDPVLPGLRWSAIGSIGVRVASGVRGLLVARLVGPRAMGVFAAVFAFVAIANTIAELGLQTYLISRGRQAREHAREVLELVFVTGVVGAIALVLLADPIANLYDERSAHDVALVLAGSVLLAAGVVVPNALLRVEMRFRAVARAQVLGECAALAVGVSLALADAGVWALVWAVIANQLVTGVALWAARPAWNRARAPVSTRGHALRYGLTIAVGSLLWAAAIQGDNIAVGRIAGATALGFYAFAYNYGVLPGVMIGSIVTDVAMASFVNAESTAERRTLFLRFARITALVGAPIVSVGVAFIPQAVDAVLGDAWRPVVGPLRAMLLLGFIRGLLPAEVLLRAVGRVRVELMIGIVAAPATIVAAVVTASNGITTVAVAVVLVQGAAAVCSTYVALRELQLSVRSVVSAVGTPIVMAVAVAGAAALLAALASLTPLLGLGASAVAFVGSFAVIRSMTPGRWSELRAIALARSSVGQAR